MSILNNLLYDADTISSLEAAYGLGGSGLPSQARHQAAVNELAKTLTPVDFGPANLLGRTAAFLGASATEIPDLIRTGDFREAGRDIKDNFIGAFLTDQNKTPADIFAKVYGMGDTGSPIKTETTGGIRDFSMFDQARMGGTTQPPSFRSLNDPEVYGEIDQSRELGERKNLLERILEFAPFIGEKSLTGILTNALGGAKNRLTNFRDAIGRRLGPAPFGTSQAAFNALTPSQQQSVASIYGQGGIMQGYNPVSAFGRGPVGAIQNRIDAILERKAAGKRYGKTNLARLQQALTDVGGGDSGSSFDSDTGGTFGSSVDDASTFSDYS